jgi:2-dehydro-3-deoxy-D-arabinonate dehydratase
MHLYKTREGALVVNESKSFLLTDDWDAIVNRPDLHSYLSDIAGARSPLPVRERNVLMEKMLAPIGNQEVWAAGVTYLRSRDARMEESKDSGAADVYQKVYEADRPELFFKALPKRVSGHGEPVYMRHDSSWNVPEPELTLFINSQGTIQGYTIGNDMSSRSIEGENPLYLPQAKIYERSCALGPCLWVPAEPISPETEISISIIRKNVTVFSGSILLNRLKRTLPELAAWLFKACRFERGCYLMTGTGIVPPNDFTLQENDTVEISIAGIGKLRNEVGVI